MDINTELLLEQIKLYYLRSFRTDPEELGELLVRVLDGIGAISDITPQSQVELNSQLMIMLDAMERNDYVLIRDIIWYEIKPFLERKVEGTNGRKT